MDSRSLVDIIRQFMQLGDLQNAESHVILALNQRCDQGNLAEIWFLQLTHADLMRLRGQTGQALAYLNEKELESPPSIRDIASQSGLKKLRGYYLGLLGKYPQCHTLLREAELLASEAGLLELQCEVYQCQAMIHYLQRNYVASDRIFRIILAASDTIGGWYFRANALWGIGKNLMIQEHYEAAIPWLEEAQDLFETAGAGLSAAVVWGELAVCYLGLGDDRRSLELLEKASEVTRSLGVV